MTMSSRWFISGVVALLLVIYSQTAGFEFINYDDESYVTANPSVLAGLTGESIAWAFSSVKAFYWHPLTWLSLMLDVTLFGPAPGALHMVNVALHIGTVVTVFLALHRFTGHKTRSMVVSALFGLHPLRVESVAWVAERKDVLSGSLTALTLLAYARYVKQPGPKRYGVVLVLFALACMAKPSVVIVPVLLLLLDYWPLHRRAFREKLPMFVMAAALTIVTIVGQKQSGALDFAGPIPAGTRFLNAIYSLGQYLWTTVWPSALAVIYPYPREFPGVAFVGVALIGITAAAWWQRNARPWILTGWLWFVVGLLPTLGLIQAGAQGRADRFTYIPHIGLLIAMVWLAAEFLPKRLLPIVTSGVVVVLTFLSWRQTSLWQDSRTLFAHTLSGTSDNWLGEFSYGLAMLEENRADDYRRHMTRAATLNPSHAVSRYHLGRLAAESGQPNEAERWFAEAVRLKPDYADAHYSRAAMLMALGRPADALPSFERALHSGLAPEWAANAHDGVGVVLANSGRFTEAEKHFREALTIKPDSAEALRHLSSVLQALRRPEARP
jgi:hypothetical protein